MVIRRPADINPERVYLSLISFDYVQRDYVKWRGVVFLQFLLSLVDESEKITHLADFLFSSILKGTVPKIPQAKCR